MTAKRKIRVEAEPTWEVAHLFPHQGHWSEEEYLALTTNHLVEFSHGLLEVPPMPTRAHQRMVALLYRRLFAFVTSRKLGEVYFAPYRVQLWPGKYREPDILYLRPERSAVSTNLFAAGADLVIEVVSPDDPRRDLDTKRREYAQAGIPENWIVDPELRTITVLTLVGENYAVAGVYSSGQSATSALLRDFAVSVDEVFAEQ